MSPRNLRIRLGLFVLLAAVLFAGLIVMFGSLPRLFKRTSAYTIRFADAPGLAAGAPVRRSGVRIGEVTDITLDEDLGIVRVHVAILRPHLLRRSEQATLVTGLLGSDAGIDLIPKAADDRDPVDRSPFEPGSELVGARAATVGTLLKGASDVVPSALVALNDIRKSMARLERLAARVEKSVPLADDAMREYRSLAQNLNKQIPNVERTNADLQRLIHSAQEVVPEVQRAADEYRQLGRDARTALPEFLKTNREIQELSRSVRESLPTVQSALEEVQSLSENVRREIPTIRRTIDDIGVTARNANSFLEELDVFWRKNRDTVEDTLRNVNRASGRAADVFTQAANVLTNDNIKSINRTIKNAEATSDRLPQLTRDLTDTAQQAQSVMRQVNTTTVPQLNATLKTVNDTSLPQFNALLKRLDGPLADIERVTRPLGERSERISRNVDEATAQMNQILGDVRALFRAIDRSDGTFRKILTDPSLYNNVDTAVVMVTRILPRVDRILHDFEVFADKLARHPESVGLGGVVRPGSGLKNPPTPPITSQPPAMITQPVYSPRR
ncbi:MAG: MlaD family protein [Gemmataceae bacterium]